jgi:hypothetical protein
VNGLGVALTLTLSISAAECFQSKARTGLLLGSQRRGRRRPRGGSRAIALFSRRAFHGRAHRRACRDHFLLRFGPARHGRSARLWSRARPLPLRLRAHLDSIDIARTGTDAAGISDMDRGELRLSAEQLHTCDERAVTQAHHAFPSGPFMNLLPRIRAPLLLLAAGQGGAILPNDLKEIRATAPAIDIAAVPTRAT